MGSGLEVSPLCLRMHMCIHACVAYTHARVAYTHAHTYMSILLKFVYFSVVGLLS